ncbi:MAG: cupin domain-containing protein [Rhodospirillaceae bacterium]|mgnify:FL=1|jgi:quercetin dioxygenase-like cupin family protein|nr:cupin domain-containing protein [Rhodospirillaceae bacterium]
MAINIRRIVTDHDADGKAIVSFDSVMDNVTQLRSGNSNSVLWMTEDTPAEIEGGDDPAYACLDIEPPERGSIFRIIELMPGKEAYMHRTDTIDYAIVLAGECVMELDGDDEVTMYTGDVLVQRATWHGWANRSDAPCQIAFVLIGGKTPSNDIHMQK